MINLKMLNSDQLRAIQNTLTMTQDLVAEQQQFKLLEAHVIALDAKVIAEND
jgi:hypothetical protein